VVVAAAARVVAAARPATRTLEICRMHHQPRNSLCALPLSLWATIAIRIAIAAAPVQLDDAWVDASRYAPGTPVLGSAVLRNTTGAAAICTVAVQVTHLATPVATVTVPPVLVPAAGVTTAVFAWLPPARDFTGYLLELSAAAGGMTSAPITTAVDVSSDWRVFPRYGYISAYGALSSAEINATIEQLNRYHLNGLQFYDWQNYKHHIPLAGTVADPAASWPDIANRDNRFLTVTRYLTAAHARRMTCMNYNLLYGASSNCYADGLQPQWGLYDDAGHATQSRHILPSGWATPYINVFNPLHADWRTWIFNEEEKVFKVFGFDGWHVDQLGKNGYSWEGSSIDMASAYGSFLSAARARLGQRYTFNAVNEWGGPNVADTVDFSYVEVWPGSSETCSRYLGFQWMFAHCRSWSGNLKNIVFAAYLNRDAAAFNTTSVLLADAAIYATGGAHLELGDHGLLGNEYFPNVKPASATLMTRLRRYYDVITAYQNMLRDRDVVTITRDVASAALPLSTWDEPGHVWSFARQKRNMEILHLINLTSLTTNAWNDANGTYAAPTVVSNVTLQYFTTQRVDRVTLVSPDYALGAPVAVAFATNTVGGRACVTCTLPYLHYWSMLLFRAEPRTYFISAAAQHTFDGRTPATAFRTIYEADQAISYGDGDTILIDAGTTNGALGYVYSSGGPAGAVSRFQRLRDTTPANDITIAGINGMPVIVAEYPPVQLHGVRYNCTISNLAFVVSNGPAVAVANQNSYAADPNVGASARWYPASGGNMVIANCLISNVTAASAIVFGVNGAFDGRETADIYTVIKGAQIMGNQMHVAGVGAVTGAVRFNQYGGGTDVLIANNTIRGPGMSASGAADAINVAWNNGKDTAFVISNNQIHGWSGRALALDIGASAIRENLIWDVGGPAVQVDGGVAGGTPNMFVNNTIWNVNGNCAQTQYDTTATNWWVNNLFLRAAGSAYVCWSGGGARNMFDACLSYEVMQMYNIDASEAGANYWYYDPGLVTTNRNSDAFLALEYHTSSTQALYCGAARYGGQNWLGVGGGIQGGAPLDIPEPTAALVLLAGLFTMWKQR